MRINDQRGVCQCELQLSTKCFGQVGVYNDRIVMEYNNNTLKDCLSTVIDVTIKAHRMYDCDNVTILFVPNIQRRRFDIMLYLVLSNGIEVVVGKLVTSTAIEERRLIVDEILKHRDIISKDIYLYYENEYARWRGQAFIRYPSNDKVIMIY